MKISERRLVRDLRKLISIESYEDSQKISRWLRGKLRRLGIEASFDEDGNIVASIGEGPGFMLNAHMDTVGPGRGWKRGPFTGEVKDGRVYGRGASDCKAGIASMLEIARILKKKGVRKRVVFTLTAFEEGYTLEKNGIYKILMKLAGIEKGIILEPSSRKGKIGIAVGCRGSARYRIEIHGKRGHSAYTPPGNNPIYRFPALLERVRKVRGRSMKIGLIRKRVGERLTVTQIFAREGANVIAGKCDVTIDRRSLPDEKPSEFFGRMKAICDESLKKGYTLTQESGFQGYLFVDRKFLEACKQSAREAGLEPLPYFELARIDASVLYNFSGIGTYMMGPGHMEQAHKRDEYCEVESLVKATEAVLRAVEKWDAEPAS